MMTEATTQSNADQNKILAIEDDPEVLALYKSYLQKRGYHVLSATGASEGMSLLQRNPDTRLILLDLNLPDMSGTDILERVKSDPELKKTPVVVLTTTDDKIEIQRCYDLGCNVYITKPVNYESFADAIRQLGLFLSVMKVPEPDA
jgi:CheY-like chemotaxis protein